MQRDAYEFIAKQTNDPIVDRKQCVDTGEDFAVFASDLQFYDSMSPIIDGQKYTLPTPQRSPNKRRRRRLAYKNERTLYKRICDLTQKPILSIYGPHVAGPVYNTQDRRSDKRNPLDFGEELDENKTFFAQFSAFRAKVPKIAILNDNGTKSENIAYCQNVVYSKDCYLTTVAWKLENVFYSSNMSWGEWLIDCFFVMDSYHCYECRDSYNLYGCFWIADSWDCKDCRMGQDLLGCQDCIGCFGLRNKQYCIFNEQYTPEAFAQYMQDFKKELLHNKDGLLQKFHEFVQTKPHKAMNIINGDTVYGSNLVNAKDVVSSFNVKNIRECKYCVFGDGMNFSMDLTVGGEQQRCYESITPDFSYKALFTIFCWSCTDVWYSDMCHGCRDCFGCIGLKNQQYCIFNKQYSKDDYYSTIAKIISKMQQDNQRWEFFPRQDSPFCYNESAAQDYFPANKKDIEELWWNRLDTFADINIPDGVTFVHASTLPGDPAQCPDMIADTPVQCQETGRLYRILQKELDFYRKRGIPLPRIHHDQRYLYRIQHMPSKDLFVRACSQTWEKIISVYPSDVWFPVWSQRAYDEQI
jgi:hypothetical protein